MDEPTIFQDVMSYVIPVVGAFVSAVVSLLATKALAYIKGAIDEQERRALVELVDSAVNSVEEKAAARVLKGHPMASADKLGAAVAYVQRHIRLDAHEDLDEVVDLIHAALAKGSGGGGSTGKGVAGLPPADVADPQAHLEDPRD